MNNLAAYFRLIIGLSFATAAALSPSASSAQSATTYTYDALGRLTGVRDGTGYTSDYALDKASNRTNLKVTEQFPQAWAAMASNIFHGTGQAQYGGWSATVANPTGYMIYGPYVTVPAGSHVAAYRMVVDDNTYDNNNVVAIDVYDSQLGIALASRIVTRKEWKTANNYEVFELPFTLGSGSVGHNIEFRVFYYAAAYVRVERVGYR